MISICFFGDSICFGQGISIHKGWVARISAELERISTELGCSAFVTNASVNGNTTRMALERMPYEVQSHQFDLLLIQFGMNDCNYWATDRGVPRVSPMAFKANLHEIIERAQRFGVKEIFLNTNHYSGRNQSCFEHAPITYQESNQYYNTLIREVAFESGAGINLNDIERRFQEICLDGKYDKYLLEDGLHLNELGHCVYFDYIFPKIRACMERTLNI